MDRISRSLAHCSFSVSRLPSSVEENPHWGLRHSWSRGTYFSASRIRAMMSSSFSSSGGLGGHQAQDHLLVFDEPEGFEAPGPVTVVFQEKSVHTAAAEEGFRHRFVPAAGEPGGPEVAPADVHGDGHVIGFGFQGPIDHFYIMSGQFVQVKAPFCVGLPLVGVAEFAPAGVVQLQVPAAGGVESLDGVLVGRERMSVNSRFWSWY